MPIFGTKPQRGPQPAKPGDFQNNWDATAKLVQTIQAYDSILDETRSALKRRMRSQDLPTVLATLTVLDSIALNCSKQVRRQLADKKWSKAIFEGCNNLPEAQPPLHKLLANWAVLYSGEELGTVCEQACLRYTQAGHPSTSATAFAYEMRELIEQDTPMIGFQRGTDFGEMYGSSQSFNAPDAARNGFHAPARSSSASSQDSKLSQQQAGHPGDLPPSALAALNRIPEVEHDLRLLGDILGRCQRLHSQGASEDTAAGTSLAGDVALGKDAAGRCTGWSEDLKGLIQQDLGDAILAQLLDLNDRLNIRLRTWHQLCSQLRPGQAHAQTGANAAVLSTGGAAQGRPPLDAWASQGSSRSLGSVEGVSSSSGASLPGRWSPAPGSLGIVAPKESQQQGPPTPGLQDARRPGRMGEDAWDAFPAQDHPAPAASAGLQSPPLIDFTDTEAQPAATQGAAWNPSFSTAGTGAASMHSSSAFPAVLATSSPLMGHATPSSTPAPLNNFQQPEAGRMPPWPSTASMPAAAGPSSQSQTGNRPQSGFLRTQPALEESDSEQMVDAEPDEPAAQGPRHAPWAAQHGAAAQAEQRGGQRQVPSGPFQQGMSGQAPSGQHAQQQGSGSLGTGWQASFSQPSSTAASAAEDIALQQLHSRLPQAARDQQGEAGTAAQMERAGSAASRHSLTHDDREAADMAALAAGTLALQRQIKAMTATHATELKDLRESHAAELADVKGRAVTRIKELQAEVAATKQGSQTSSDLGRATVLAAADQLRESQQEAQQLSAALQAAQAEVRDLQAQLARAHSRQHHAPKPHRPSNLQTDADDSILASAPDLSGAAQAGDMSQPPAAVQPMQRPSSAFSLRVPQPAMGSLANGDASHAASKARKQQSRKELYLSAVAEADMRAYYHQPALRVRFSPSQFADMARRLDRTRSQQPT